MTKYFYGIHRFRIILCSLFVCFMFTQRTLCPLSFAVNSLYFFFVWFQICPHLPWQLMFYSFGFLGFIWCIMWLLFYVDISPAALQEYEEEFEESNKVKWLCIIILYFLTPQLLLLGFLELRQCLLLQFIIAWSIFNLLGSFVVFAVHFASYLTGLSSMMLI